MTIKTIIRTLNEFDVGVALDGDNLRVTAPQDRVTPKLRKYILDNKELIVDWLKAKEAEHSIRYLKKLRKPEQVRFPLSFAQQRIWFLAQYAPDSSLYNIPVALDIKGALQIDKLQEAFYRLVQRHESLRTLFKHSEGEPYQEVLANIDIPFSVSSITNIDNKDRELDIIQEQEQTYCFDLRNEPAFRVKLICVGPEEFTLILTIHHIIADQWSLNILFKELSSLYSDCVAGLKSGLPDLNLQYPDYTLWQKSSSQIELQERQLEYWRSQLAGQVHTLDLPYDKLRPVNQSFKGNDYQFEVSGPCLSNLKEIAKDNQSTLFMILLAAYYVLFFRFSNQKDISIGTAVANRTHKPLESIIGLFTNNLVLRGKINEDLRFIDFLEEVRCTVVDGLKNQDLSFEKLVERLKVPRDTAYSPLFQAMFILQTSPVDVVKTAEIDISRRANKGGISKYDLSLYATEQNGTLSAVLEYNTDLFIKDTIHLLVDCFQSILSQISDNPNLRIKEIGTAQKSQINNLIDISRSVTSELADSTIHGLFERRVSETPDAKVIVGKGDILTYRELNAKANQIAHYLLGMGVRYGSHIAVCVNRGPNIAIAFLAILKAGCAYIPIDPNYPMVRKRHMIDKSNVKIILTECDLLSTFDDISDCQLLTLDQPNPPWIDCSTDEQFSSIPSGSIAYTIFTSGSTGQPKGVQVSHSSVVNLLNTVRNDIGPTNDDTILSVTAISFDIFALEIFLPLVNGCRLVIADEHTVKDPYAISDLINEHRVTVMQATPETWKLMLQIGDKFPNLKTILCGGEELSSDLAERLLDHTDNLWNMYGPTETTIWSTSKLLSNKAERITLGRPLQNTQVLVLDEGLNLLPKGVPGEICIGGSGLAQGYLDNPALTAEKFVPNAYSNNGERLYRTGDFGRINSDNSFGFVSRIDNQVKLHGYRIEKGEIEVHIRKFSHVRNAVVELKADNEGDVRLVAYLVKDDKQNSIDIDHLRRHLKDNLPAYMVPTYYLVLDILPLTPNGKVDRNALPNPDKQDLRMQREHVEPSTVYERNIAEVWSGLLKQEKISIYDNFFDIGGHSLTAVQAVTRIRQKLGLELLVRDIFEHPTVYELAVYASGSSLRAQSYSLPPIVPVDRDKEEVASASFAQERLWFLDQFESEKALYNVPVAVQVRGEVDQKALQRAVNSIVARHESLRMVFDQVDGKLKQIVLDNIDVKLKIIELNNVENDSSLKQASKIRREEAAKTFDLKSGPLIRVCLVTIKDDLSWLLLTIHHIITDGWSIGILQDELAEAYAANIDSRDTNLSNLTVQYSDYSHWQRSWLKGDVLNEQILYWKNQLEGAQELLSLPLDFPRPPQQTFNGASHRFSIDTELNSRLKKLNREEGVTSFMTLLTAYFVLLNRYSGDSDICIGTPISGRDSIETERMIGLFVNTIVLRGKIEKNITFRNLLTQIKTTSLEAYQYQHLPFEKLVNELNIPRNLSHSALFQVLFVLQNTPEPYIKASEIELSPIQNDSLTTKFDLTLEVNEHKESTEFIFVYNSDLFKEKTIIKMADNYCNLLQSIVVGPDTSIDELSFLSKSERNLLCKLQSGHESFSEQYTLHDLIEKNSSKYKESPAVESLGETISYKELNYLADKVAAILREQNIGPGSIVAVYTSRSIEFMIYILGVLKSGAAYLPIDSKIPQARIEYMISDSHAAMILTESVLYSNVKDLKRQILCTDREGLNQFKTKVNKRDDFLDGLDCPLNTAYLIYTSGSTGNPKGVAVQHQGIAEYCLSALETQYSTNLAGSVVANSISFDATIPGLFMPLISGGRVLLLPDDDALSSLYQMLHQSKESWLFRLTPSHIKAFLNYYNKDEVINNNGHVFVIGGESLTAELGKRLKQIFPGSKIIHHYGPTEAIVGCAQYVANDDLLLNATQKPLPIGTALQGCKLYVLDKNLNQQPIGVIGKLYIGGKIRLADCYLHNPKQTSEKFIPNPYSELSGDRIYDTGDLVRWNSEGNLEFLGRVDHQVKILGHRIELSEIETQILKYYGVKETFVSVHDFGGSSDDHRLVAYIVGLTTDNQINLSDLKEFLREVLPDYMIPSIFITIDNMPLTSNGKINRSALPEPDESHYIRNVEYVPPNTPLERDIAEIWCELLHTNRIGIHDNFFDLGGHSLLATQMVSRIRENIGYSISVREIFNYPTLYELSIKLEKSEKTDRLELPKIEPLDRNKDQSFPLSFAQERLWFIDKLEQSSTLYNIPIIIELEGQLNIEVFSHAINALIARHEALRTIFRDSSSGPEQVIRPELVVKIPLLNFVDCTPDISKSKAYELISSEIKTPFNLTEGPLIRVKLIQLEGEKYWAVFVIHHIITDGWSMQILQQEMAALYHSLDRGLPNSLPALRVQYSDFAHWQRKWLVGGELNRQLAYWKTQLEDAPEYLHLPVDNPRPPVQTYEGSVYRLVLEEALVVQLDRFGQEHGVSLFMSLLTAFYALLYRYSGQNDICVGSPIAGRNYQEIENIVGLFVNTLVLRSQINDNTTFNDLLINVRKTTLDAYQNQDLPFEKLISSLDVSRDLSYAPLFQVMFILQNTPRSEMQDVGINMSLLETNITESKFDITLSLSEIDGVMECSFIYNKDIFEASTIERIAKDYRCLVDMLIKDDDSVISKVSLESSIDIDLISNEASLIDIGHQEIGIDGVFENIANSMPTEIAIVHGDRQVTYRELNSMANKVCTTLLEQSLPGESIIGISLNRSIEFVASVLGILRSGSAYVALDKKYPQTRIEYIINDTGLKYIISDSDSLDIFELDSSIRVFDIDSILNKNHIFNDHGKVSNSNHARNLAYIIYTSGTTGNPKGVELEHRGIINMAAWQHDVYELSPGDRVAQAFSFNFDGAVGETFCALLNGSTLRIIDDYELEPNNLSLLLAKGDLDVLVMVPSLLEQLDPSVIPVGSNICIISVGEPCPVNLLNKWKSKVRFFNAYGPTEYSVYSHYWKEQKDINVSSTVPIGKAIWNTNTYVLDKNMEICPSGVPGELYISGAGIGRGYLNKPELNFSHFLPNHHFIERHITYHGFISTPEAQSTIKKFKELHKDFEYDSLITERTEHLTTPESIPDLIGSLSVDVKDSTLQLISKFPSESHEYKGFVRYLLEGMNNTYQSAGIDISILKNLIPLDSFQEKRGVDFGMGAGEVMQVLSDHGAYMIGLDQSPFFIQAAMTKGLDARLCLIDSDFSQFVKDTHIEARSMDFALSTLVLDRVSNPRNLINNIVSCVKENGFIAIQTLMPIVPIDDGDVLDPIVYTEENKRIAPGKSTDQDELYITSLLFESGIRDIHIYKIPYVVSSRDSIQEYTIWSICGQLKIQNSVFSDSYFARMYRTGDLVRWNSSGELEFLGRVDNQIKLRGHRIELAEIESQLLRQECVDKALVDVYSPTNAIDDQRLVAYYVIHDNKTAPDPSQLRVFLKKRLPDYMVPTAFVLLDKFPLTDNGKIDRKLLPQPDSIHLVSCSEFVPPFTKTQHKVIDVWAEMLHAHPIGIYDNFFDLGGHSLLATQVVSRLQVLLDCEVSVRDIFNNPTAYDLSEAIDTKTNSIKSDITKITKLDRATTKDFPLSFAQERLWFLDKLDGSDSLYNVSVAIELNGPLNTEAFKLAVNALISRHETLRTVFRSSRNAPVQIIIPKLTIDIPLTILPDQPIEEKEARAREIVNKVTNNIFDLEEGPLVYAHLLRIEENRYWAIITLHHIITDGWSTGILQQELVAIYAEFDGRTTHLLEDVGVQYADYAYWERGYLQGEVLQRQLDYWTQKLEGAPELLQLPTDRKRPLVQTYNGSEYCLTLPSETAQRLYPFCQKHSVSPFMFLISAFYILLYRYTGQKDICIGTPVAGRTRSEFETIVGLFVNTLVIRGVISSELTLYDFLRQIRKTTLDAYQHQDLPFEKLVSAMELKRNLSYPPVFQVMFVLQNTPQVTMLDVDLDMKPLEVEAVSAKFDITLSVLEIGNSIECYFQYNTDLFNQKSIERMASSYRNIINQMVSDLSSKICNIKVFDKEDYHYLLRNLNQGKKDIHQLTVHQIFESQVESTPGSIAVTDGDRKLTYLQLNERANQLAWYLSDIGARHDQMIGVCMDRSVDMVIAILAILKAGCAYVPIAPDYPRERIKYMVEQSQIRFMLTNLDSNLNLSGSGIRYINLVNDFSIWQDNPLYNMSSIPGYLNLAYVIFTSGSTGNPKGVNLTHEGLVNVVQYMKDTIQIGPNDCLLALSAISFDIASLEILLPIVSGASVVIASESISRDPHEISQLSHLTDVNIIQATPQTWRMIVSSRVDLPHLKTIVCGGEPLPMVLANEMLLLTDNLINGYGPSETTIYSTTAHITNSDAVITLGRPISNTQIYILDDDMNPTPIGVPGELYIGGCGVGRGYLNRPDLTAERFVPNYFLGDGTRLYRTGDVVKCLEDGQLEYISRIDNQTKVDGYRIELGEIEHNLSLHHMIDAAAVIVKSYENNLRKIIAYIIAKNADDVPSDNQLRIFLKNTLPNFMIPSEFIYIDKFPLTPNRKIDRIRLQSITGKSNSRVEPGRKARSEVEQKLYKIWVSLLETDVISIDDNFFDIGGNSLLAVFMIDEIYKSFNVRLPTAQIFESNTISRLSEYIETKRVAFEEVESPIIKIKNSTHEQSQKLLCVHPAGGGVVTYNSLIRLLNLESNVFGAQALGLSKQGFDFNSVDALASFYIHHMEALCDLNNVNIVGYSVGGLIAIEIAQQLKSKGYKVGAVILLDTVVTGRLESSNVLSDTEILLDHFKDAKVDLDEFDSLALEDKIHELLSINNKFGLKPTEANIKQIIEHIDTYKSISSVCRDYEPRGYSGHTLLISTKQSPALTSWEDNLYSTKHIILDCEHHNMMDHPHVDKVVQHVDRFLSETDSALCKN